MSGISMIPGGRAALIFLVSGVLAACGGEERVRGEDEGAPVAAVRTPADGAVVSGESSLAEPGLDGARRGEALDGGGMGQEGPAVDPSTPDSAVVAPGSAGSSGSGDATREVTPGETNGSADGAADDAVDQAAQRASTEEVLRATSRAYEGLRSFRAEFEQTLRNSLLGRTTRSEGTLYQRQPDRFLMAFSDPSEDLIVSDGEYFWMYFPSVDRKQVLRTPRGSQGLDLHAQFIGDPVRRFDATYHGMETVEGRPAHVMTLVPREPMGYSRLKVWIDRDDHLVRQFELTETNENVRHFLLRDLVRNPTLPDSLFAFEPPPGSQVVDR